MRIPWESRTWFLLPLLEAAGAAGFMASLLFEPLFHSRVRLPIWLAGAAVFLIAYLAMALWATSAMLSGGSRMSGRPHPLLWISSLPLLAGFVSGFALLQLKPGLAGWVWYLLSPIQPFPAVALAGGLLLVFLLKTLAVYVALPRLDPARPRVRAGAADVAIPAALLLVGALQASVYLVPIGNAFLRFWALADAMGAGVGYPVTLTEPDPISAGSPPYVYDLPLFPVMLRGAFTLLGHNSAAAHLPATLWSALFPLSLYLLIREATGSRVVALVFAMLGSLFPYLRLWVLNLPDPDPLLLTSLCLAAYLYLRALAVRERPWRWVAAGLAAGVLALARPEGLLYAGFLTLGVLACRPGARRVALFLLCLSLFLAPLVALWMANFGFLWPQNYNRALGPDYPLRNYEILQGYGALAFYHQGLGLDARWGAGVLALFLASVAFGTLAMLARDRRLLAIAVPGIGNTVAIFFANPYIPNTYHFADFFRHASFGIPFLVVASAYGFSLLYHHLAGRERHRWLAYAGLLLLVATVAREGDILANPTASHRPGNPVPTQVLTTYTYLSMESILARPMPLPAMSYRREGAVTVAYPTGGAWPEDALRFFEPLDMAFDSHGRAFGYASVALFLLALGFALLARDEPGGEDSPALRTRLRDVLGKPAN